MGDSSSSKKPNNTQCLATAQGDVVAPCPFPPRIGSRYCRSHARECAASADKFHFAFAAVRKLESQALTDEARLESLRTFDDFDTAIRVTDNYLRWVREELEGRRAHGRRFSADGESVW